MSFSLIAAWSCACRRGNEQHVIVNSTLITHILKHILVITCRALTLVLSTSLYSVSVISSCRCSLVISASNPRFCGGREWQGTGGDFAQRNCLVLWTARFVGQTTLLERVFHIITWGTEIHSWFHVVFLNYVCDEKLHRNNHLWIYTLFSLQPGVIPTWVRLGNAEREAHRLCGLVLGYQYNYMKG